MVGCEIIRAAKLPYTVNYGNVWIHHNCTCGPMEDLWDHCAAILLNVLCVLLHIYGGCVSEKCSPVNSCGFFNRKRGEA